MNLIELIKTHKELREGIIIIAMASLLIGLGIGAAIYDKEVTSMLNESSVKELPMEWRGELYRVKDMNITAEEYLQSRFAYVGMGNGS